MENFYRGLMVGVLGIGVAFLTYKKGFRDGRKDVLDTIESVSEEWTINVCDDSKNEDPS